MYVKKNADYKMPESFNAFCKMVSLIAANTSRILEVSVACVKLDDQWVRGYNSSIFPFDLEQSMYLLRVDIKFCSIDLAKSPKDILCSLINIRSTRIIREIPF